MTDWEMLETVKQARACVRRLPCTCNRSLPRKEFWALPRSARRFCDRCNAELMLLRVRKELETRKRLIKEYEAEGGFECDGTNCPPRAHDHKVTI